MRTLGPRVCSELGAPGRRHRKARNADRFASTGSGEQFPHARRAFMDKGRPRAQDRLRRLEYLAAPFSSASIAFFCSVLMAA
jgi:hypothetical protein